jgi:hypothetical protein
MLGTLCSVWESQRVYRIPQQLPVKDSNLSKTRNSQAVKDTHPQLLPTSDPEASSSEDNGEGNPSPSSTPALGYIY